MKNQEIQPNSPGQESMQHNDSADLSMLSWCAGEIRQALESADEHLTQQLACDSENSLLGAARSSLHQAHGALGMVDLPGTTQITAEAELLLSRIEDEEITLSADVVSKISAAFSAVNEYLDELLRGDHQQPLRLFPYLKDLLELRSADRIHPADLFFPELVRLPAPTEQPVALSNESYGSIRAQFENGLLGALRDSDDVRSKSLMADAIEQFHTSELAGTNHTFWIIANAYFRALKTEQLSLDAYGKRLLARINLQVRRTFQDGAPVADRLLRDTLFSIACGSDQASELKPIFDKFALAGMVPANFDKPRYRKIDRRASEAATDAIAEMKKTWETMLAQSGGVAEFLGQFKQGLARFREAADELGVDGLDRLTAGWVGVVKALSLDSGPVSDAVGVEVATSLLFVEQLFAFGLKDFEDLPGRCGELSRRIDATLQDMNAPDDAPKWLRELTATVQERLTIAAFTSETQAGLREAESILDGFFRDPAKGRDALPTASGHFKQIAGVLRMLGHDGPADAADYLAGQTDQMAQGEEPNAEALSVMAGSVGTLGFFLDAIKASRTQLSSFRFDSETGIFEQIRESAEVARTFERTAGDDYPVVTDEPSQPAVEESAESVLAQLQEKLDTALVSWADSPEASDQQMLVAELLQNVCDSAQLIDAADLLSNAQASIEFANSGRDGAALEIAQKLGRPASLCELQLPEQPAAALPEAEEDVDEELLEIFLAEAAEVLESMGEALTQLEQAPADQMTLTTIRRGFHTLKGSSRMVGLDAFGDAAWPLEQVLNTWLAEEKRAESDLLRLIAQAREVFAQWVASLEPGADRTPRPDPTVLVARAEAMRNGESFDSVADVAEPEAPAVPGNVMPVGEPEPATAQVEESAVPELVEATEPLAEAEVTATAESEPSVVVDAIGFDFDGDAAVDEPEQDNPVIQALAEQPVIAPEPEVVLPDLSTGDPVAEPEAELTSVSVPEPATPELSLPELDLPVDLPELPELTDLPEVDPVAAIADQEPSLDEEASLTELAASFETTVEVPALEETVEPVDEVESPVTAEQVSVASEPVADDVVTIGELEISRPLFEVFVEESRQLQGVLVPDAQDWVQDPSRSGSEDSRRALHSLKGSAALVQIEPVRRLASTLEQFMARQIATSRPIGEESAKQYAGFVEVLFQYLADFGNESNPVANEAAEAGAQALHDDWLARSEAAAAPAPSPAKAIVVEQHDEDDLPAVQDEFDEELLPLFIEEAEEYLPQIDENLRAWQQTPGDAQLQQLIMRQFHTVKGSARMAGAMVLGQRVHDMETRVEAAMAMPEVPASLIEELLAEQDIVSDQFEYIRDPSLKPPAAAEQTAPAASAATGSTESVQAAAPVAPAAAEPVAKEAEAARTAQKAPLVRVRSEVLDKMVNEAGEVSIARSRLDNSVGSVRAVMNELSENVNRLRSYVRELEMQGEMRIQASKEAAQESSEEFDPLEFDRFTRFQELTRMMAESVNDVGTVQANATRAIEEAVADLGRQGQNLRQLQHNLMGIRMVQFGTVNDRLYRVVRQAAKSLGKRVSLDIRGATVQMDRGVLEKMVAPLEHLLRNAVSHGIEEPEQRSAAGKRETGDIRLEVVQDGNEIVISLSDDGGGLNLQRIRERAIERSLIQAEDKPTDARLADMIFMPGFSTAKGVDQISGRGVGMDVVRSEVALLSGRVQVTTDAGQGSRFVVHLPLTMAIEQVMVVNVGERRYAMPSANVEQIIQLDPDQLSDAYAKRSVAWQDEQVPLYYCGALVHAPEQKMLAQHQSPVIIVKSGGRRIAVHADEVSKSQEVVVKNVGQQAAKVTGIAGATLMGNGEVVLILNLGQLAGQLSDSEQEAAMQAGVAAGLADAPPTVMVVDDSVTVRKVTQRFLSRESFDVMLAKDGVDALRQLEERMPEVMLVDVEMPRMDGFDLTRALRKDPRFKSIPVIMITSRTADKHRNFALSLGVNEYLGKPYDESRLLEMINVYVARQKADKMH